MGLLGQHSNAFLSDRIFDVYDRDKDGCLTYNEYATIMDVMCNGDTLEKNEFSFRLID
jgi:Ca2+-binding EF-hand superfamily protein